MKKKSICIRNKSSGINGFELNGDAWQPDEFLSPCLTQDSGLFTVINLHCNVALVSNLYFPKKAPKSFYRPLLSQLF